VQTQTQSLTHSTHHIQQTTSGGHKSKEVKRARPTKLKIEYISEDEDAVAMPVMTEPFTSKDPSKGKRAKPTADDSDNDSVQEMLAAVGTKCAQPTTVSSGTPETQV
jgi:Cu/Ag efflux protein CusF